MTLIDSISPTAAAAATIEWYDRIKNIFTDFKPETMSLTINFSRGVSQIGSKITVPDGLRKKRRKIKIPVINGYNIVQMLDGGFQEQTRLWKLSDGYFVLNARDLPKSEHYLLTMEGNVEKKVLESFVFIKQAANRDNDDQDDKYWLDASLKQPGTLEKIYDDLAIDDINVGVEVNIEKMFGLTLPKEMEEKASAIHNLLEASSSNFDRNKLFKAALAYKKQARVSPTFDPGNFAKIIQKLTARDVIEQYINIERPYNIDNIEQPVKYVNIVPQSIKVQALTRLTLEQPIAAGYLVFNREKYLNKLRSEFQKLI